MNGLVLASFLRQEAITIEAKGRGMTSDHPDAAGTINFLANCIPWDPTFRPDLVIVADWQISQNDALYHYVFMVEDNDYQNSGHTRFFLFFQYARMTAGETDPATSQYARVGMNGPNFGEQTFPVKPQLNYKL